MPVTKLIADSGATKTEWCLLQNGKKKTIIIDFKDDKAHFTVKVP